MLLLLLPLLLLLVLGGAGPASAHAVLRASDPQDGTVLAAAPRFVTLTFTESVGLLDDSLRMFGPDGRRVHTGAAQHAAGRADTVRVTLPARLGGGRGTFTVAWRVVSADSHPVSGAFTFSVGRASATAATVGTGPVENPATGALYDLARYVAYVAVALLLGTAAFVLLCRPPRPALLRTPFATGWWALLGSTVVLLVLRAPYETGEGPAAAFGASAAARTLDGRPGALLLARLALLAVAAVLARRTRRTLSAGRERHAPRGESAAWAALAVALALTWAAADHASAGVQVPAAMTSTVLHLLAMAVWMGGLVALLTLLNRTTGKGSSHSSPGEGGPPEEGDPPGKGDLPGEGEPTEEGEPGTVTEVSETVARFSRIAFAAVTVLVGTGVYQSWRGLGSWQALTGTTYGRILLVKTAAVVLLLVAASYSRRWTVRWAGGRRVARGPCRVVARVPELVGGAGEFVAPEVAGAPEKGPEIAVRSPTPTPTPPRTPTPTPTLPSPAHRTLRRSVLAEVALGVAVLVLTTVLTGAEPGRAQAEAARAAVAAPAAGPGALVTSVPFDVGTPAGHGTVQITLEPGRVGENTVQAVVFGPDGGLATVPELRLTFTHRGRDMGPFDAKLTNEGGYWGTADLNLPFPGTWLMRVTVRVSDLDEVTVAKRLTITG